MIYGRRARGGRNLVWRHRSPETAPFPTRVFPRCPRPRAHPIPGSVESALSFPLRSPAVSPAVPPCPADTDRDAAPHPLAPTSRRDQGTHRSRPPRPRPAQCRRPRTDSDNRAAEPFRTRRDCARDVPFNSFLFSDLCNHKRVLSHHEVAHTSPLEVGRPLVDPCHHLLEHLEPVLARDGAHDP